MSDTPRVDAERDDQGIGGYESAYKDMRDLAITLERENAALQSDIDTLYKTASDLATENAAYLAQIARMDKDLDLLREQLAEARVNEARYLWLAKASHMKSDYDIHGPDGAHWQIGVFGKASAGLAAAIDAARAKEEGNGRLAD